MEFPVGPLTINASCRITRVIDEPGRFGFVYETLPGHPLRGDELFLVEHLDDDTVRFTVHAVSAPAWPLAWAGLPVVRWIQRRARSTFVAGLRAHVAAAIR